MGTQPTLRHLPNSVHLGDLASPPWLFKKKDSSLFFPMSLQFLCDYCSSLAAPGADTLGLMPPRPWDMQRSARAGATRSGAHDCATLGDVAHGPRRGAEKNRKPLKSYHESSIVVRWYRSLENAATPIFFKQNRVKTEEKKGRSPQPPIHANWVGELLSSDLGTPHHVFLRCHAFFVCLNTRTEHSFFWNIILLDTLSISWQNSFR